MQLDKPATRRDRLRESRQRDSQRNRIAWAVGGALLIVGVALAAIWSHGDDTISRAQIGSPLSNFSLRDLDGSGFICLTLVRPSITFSNAVRWFKSSKF